MELIWSGIGSEFLLLAALAFFSGSEAAVLGCSRLKASHDAETGIKPAKAVLEFLTKKEQYLPALLAIETFLTVAISTLGTVIFRSFYPVKGSLFLSALMITLFVLVLGEIFPKTMATHKPESFAYFSAPIVLRLTQFFAVLLRPITWAVTIFLRGFGRTSAALVPTEQELQYLISVSKQHGVLNQEEEELFQNIFRFMDAKVGEKMVPRTRMVCIKETASLKEVIEQFSAARHRRYPVYSEDLDHILGFLDIQDVMVFQIEGAKKQELKTLIHPIPFVPESKGIGILLQEMRKENFRIAVVIDEYGGTAGLVTITDILEEIVGELGKAPAYSQIRVVSENKIIVPSFTEVSELEKRLGIKLETKDIVTVGGFVFGLFGRVPEKGEQVISQNLKFTILEKNGYKISEIMVENCKS
jgi:putative hemolysin